MAGDLILALDQGTTSTRAALVDAAGRRIAEVQAAHAQHHPAPGLVEHDAAEILAAAGVYALWLAIVAAPFALLAGVAIGGRRMLRRRRERRLLETA